MVDNARISSNYDIEVMLGADYFLSIFQCAYDAGKIPSQIELDNGTVLHIGQLKSVTILANDYLETVNGLRDIGKNQEAEALIKELGGEEHLYSDIEILLPVKYNNNWMDVKIGMSIVFDSKGVETEYRYLDENTKQLIILAGILSGEPDLLEKVENSLKETLNQMFDIKLIENDVATFRIKKVKAEDGYQAAYGLFINLNIKISSQKKKPEESYIERGNLDLARSFLPEGKAFMVGMGKATFGRLANDMWHSLGVVKSNGSIHHPVMKKKKKVGEYKSVSIKPKSGYMEITNKSEYFIDYWPDADITAVFKLTPQLNAGKMTYEMKLHEFDADTGLLGDFLSFMIGGLVGAIVGLFFGPIGLVIASSIGGVGGIATLEITESVKEDVYGAEVEKTAKKADIGSIFSAFPLRIRLYTVKTDPFYYTHYELCSVFEDVTLNSKGMSFGGKVNIQPAYEPEDTVIVDKKRGRPEEGIQGITRLTYKLDVEGDIELPIEEVIRRRQENKIMRVVLNPVAIKRKKSVVTDIKFLSGVDFKVEELIALQYKSVLVVDGHKLIHAKGVKPFYRALADMLIENNLEKLPSFEPED